MMRALALMVLAMGWLCPFSARGEAWTWVADQAIALEESITPTRQDEPCGPELAGGGGGWIGEATPVVGHQPQRRPLRPDSLLLAVPDEDGLVASPSIDAEQGLQDDRSKLLLDTSASSTRPRSWRSCVTDGAGGILWTESHGWETWSWEGDHRRCSPPGAGAPRLLLATPSTMTYRWLAVVGTSVLGTMDCVSWRTVGPHEAPMGDRLFGEAADWGIVILNESGEGLWLGAEGAATGMIRARLPAGAVEHLVLDSWRLGVRVIGPGGIYRLEEEVPRLDAIRWTRARLWAAQQLDETLRRADPVGPSGALRWPRLSCWWLFYGHDAQKQMMPRASLESLGRSLPSMSGWCSLDGVIADERATIRTEPGWVDRIRDRWWRQWSRWQKSAWKLRWHAEHGQAVDEREHVDCLELEARVVGWLQPPLQRDEYTEWCPQSWRYQ